MANRIATLALVAGASLLGGFGGAALYDVSGLGGKATEAYLIDNPEILPRVAEALQQKDAAQRLASVGADVEQPFPGAVLGNPQGSKTLVEFSDYNCGYCRASKADVEALVAKDPELRVVVREFPIFEGSEAPARLALAAAKQGKFAAFHNALFEEDSKDEAAIRRAADKAGLDFERAMRDATGQDVTVELAKNRSMAEQLGFSGTPSWVAGGKAFEGAIGEKGLADAIDGA